MLLKPYLVLKEKLETLPGIKLIDWFNDQYAGTIHAAPAVFVEFPVPLRFQTLREDFQMSAFAVRIHIATVAKADQSKRIDSNLIAAHDTLVDSVYSLLQGFWAAHTDGKKMFDSLGRTAYEHHQYMQGWLVTTQDFESRIYQQPADKTTAIVNDLTVTVNV